MSLHVAVHMCSCSYMFGDGLWKCFLSPTGVIIHCNCVSSTAWSTPSVVAATYLILVPVVGDGALFWIARTIIPSANWHPWATTHLFDCSYAQEQAGGCPWYHRGPLRWGNQGSSPPFVGTLPPVYDRRYHWRPMDHSPGPSITTSSTRKHVGRQYLGWHSSGTYQWGLSQSSARAYDSGN